MPDQSGVELSCVHTPGWGFCGSCRADLAAGPPGRGLSHQPDCHINGCTTDCPPYVEPEPGRGLSWECGDPYSGIGCPEPNCTHRPEGWPENATMYAEGRVSSSERCRICGCPVCHPQARCKRCHP